MSFWNAVRLLHRAWRLRLKHDRAEISFLLQHVSPGQTAVDIGANKAGYTYWLHRAVGKNGQVFAFEPQSQLTSYACDVKRILRMNNVTVVNTGLSSRSGTRELFHPAIHPCGGATLEAYEVEGTFTSVTVGTLDDYFQDRPRRPVGFIKCDVEGHELDVFKGGEELLLTDRPTLLFECCTARTEAVFSYLSDLGYEGFAAFDHACNPIRQPFSKFNPNTAPYNFNYGFVHRSHLATIPKAA